MHRPGRGKKAKHATRELPEEDPEFQIAPMIDILLVLLVFFMSIASTEVLQTNEAVRLPVARDGKPPGEVTEGVVVVNVLWNAFNNAGSMEVAGRTYYVAQDLTSMLQGELAKFPNLQVLIRADKEVRYDYLRSILKTAGVAGITNVTFSAVNRDEQ